MIHYNSVLHELVQLLYVDVESGFDGWLVVVGLTALRDNISIDIEPPLRERKKEEI